MSDVFFDSPQTGLLTYKNIYEFYDEPRFFSAEDRVGNVYVIYWIGENDFADIWYIVSISKTKLERLESRVICIRDTLLYQEESYFKKLVRPFDPDATSLISVDWIKANEIQKFIKLPRQGLFITYSPEENAISDSVSIYASHEIHIEKNSKKAKALVLEQVSRIFEAFAELYNSIADTEDIPSEIHPIGGRFGSFILSFNAEHVDNIEKSINNLFNLIDSKEDIISFSEENNIDIPLLCSFLDKIALSHTNFELKRNNDAETIFYIDSNVARSYLSALKNYSSTRVSSEQVPQANDIEKMFEVVERVANNQILSEDSLSLTTRQIKYYVHAAYTLGLLRKYGAITALGEQFATAEHEVRMKIAAKSFQSSVCGWAWIRWSNVNSIAQLNPDSAKEFLITQCASLSDNTSKRRATTLRKWCAEFQPYFVEW